MSTGTIQEDFTTDPSSPLEQDKKALRAMAKAFGKTMAWLRDGKDDVSKWKGITVEDGRVAKVSWDSERLSGELSTEVGVLTGLKELMLSNNEIGGSLPPELGNLYEALTELGLSNNAFISSVPLSLAYLKRLSYLSLHKNKFAIDVPSSSMTEKVERSRRTSTNSNLEQRLR